MAAGATTKQEEELRQDTVEAIADLATAYASERREPDRDGDDSSTAIAARRVEPQACQCARAPLRSRSRRRSPSQRKSRRHHLSPC